MISKSILLTIVLVLLCGINNLFSQDLKHYIEYTAADRDEGKFFKLKDVYPDYSAVSKSSYRGEPWDGSVAKSYNGGEGTAENPYQIATAEQLALLAEKTNYGASSDAYYILTDDINLNGDGGKIWIPIGVSGCFTGVFDGNNHTISDMHTTDYKKAGLFGYVKDATIKNLNMHDAYIYFLTPTYNGPNLGIIAGEGLNTNIYDCNVGGYIEAFGTGVGGVVGQYLSDFDDYDTIYIKNCVNNTIITSDYYTGGIAGYTEMLNNGSLVIKECKNHGHIISTFVQGGIIGEGSYIIRQCENTGKIGVLHQGDIGLESGMAAGGMVGQTHMFGIIENCINHDKSEVISQSAGGIVGAPTIYTLIKNCGNRGFINAFGIYHIFVGGICGSDGYISNCYNTGNLTGEIREIGGNDLQMGGITGTATDGLIYNVYNAGTITKPNYPDPDHGFFSHIIPITLSDTLIRNCYWIYNDEMPEEIYNVETSSYIELPESSRFMPSGSGDSGSTSWTLENPQYNTTDLLEALNSGNTDRAEWIEDTEGVNKGFPILKPLPVDTTNVKEVVNHDNISVSVYPNPARDFLKLSAISCQLSVVRIYNYLGILIEEIEINSNEIEINTSDYKSGIYLINIQGNDGNAVTKKVIKI